MSATARHILSLATFGVVGDKVLKGLTPKAPSIPAPPAALTPPDPNDPQAVADRNAAAAKRVRAPGIYARPVTLLTGPNGLTNAAPVERKTLLGD